VVPGTSTIHEVPLTGAWHVRKRSEGLNEYKVKKA
jgi:hypothetical protein